jgi:hypothetical protein
VVVSGGRTGDGRGSALVKRQAQAQAHSAAGEGVFGSAVLYQHGNFVL